MTRILLALMLAVTALALAACGGDDGEEPSATSPPATTTAEPPASAATPVQIAADPSGALKFEPTTLTVKAGNVTFEFTNDAPVGHDFVIEQDGEKVAGTDVITKSSTTLDTELKAGEYAFYCSVAGHRQAGMEGKLTVG